MSVEENKIIEEYIEIILSPRRHSLCFQSDCLPEKIWIISKTFIAQSAGTVEYRGVRPPNECSGYDTKQSDGEAPVMLGLWGIQSTPSLPLFPGPLWPGMVAPGPALSMG